MGKGQNALDAMDSMIRGITACETEIDDLTKQLVSGYETVGQDWDDEKYVLLGDAIREITIAVNAPRAKMSETVTRIQLLRSALQAYLDHSV